jgi:NADP-dependent 3-hydroxy acid dehydrogenase YdfG
VSGASSGVGRAIALALGRAGVRLCLVGRRPGALEPIVAALPAGSPVPLIHRTDVTVDADVRALANRVRQELGRADILVNCAATIALGPLATASLDEFDVQYRTNLRAPYALTQALLPLLRESHGQIVFINSTAAVKASGGAGQYAATKQALRAVADSLREEVNADGVRVLTVYVGRTATPMQETVHSSEGRVYRPDRLIQPDDIAAMVLSALTASRSVEVTEITLRPLAKPD